MVEILPSYYRLVLDFVDTHSWQAPHLTVDVNGAAQIPTPARSW